MTPDTPEGTNPDLPDQPVPAQNPIPAPPGEVTPPNRAAGGRE